MDNNESTIRELIEACEIASDVLAGRVEGQEARDDAYASLQIAIARAITAIGKSEEDQDSCSDLQKPDCIMTDQTPFLFK